MDGIPARSQTGGRPPDKAKTIKSNGNTTDKFLGNTSCSQTGTILKSKASGEAIKAPNPDLNSSNSQSRVHPQKKNNKSKGKKVNFDNKKLGNDLHEAVFGKESPSLLTPSMDASQDTLESCNEDSTIFNLNQDGSLDTDMDYDTNSNSSTDDDFKTVTMKKKRTFEGDVKINLKNFKYNKSNNVETNVNRTNKYSLLGELDIESERDMHSLNHSHNKNTNNNKTKILTRNSFCPPIFLQHVNIKSLVDQLKSKNIEFKIQNKSKFKSKLFLKDASAHTEMMQLLRDKEITSYSYTPKELKRQNIVCRGLYHKLDVNDIKLELDKFVPDTIDSVSKFSTEYSKKQNIDTGLFLVTLKANRNIKEILGIRYILNQVVSWERPKVSSKIPQCWRCELWGHFSRNCNRPFACMKCDKKHAPGECAVISGSDVTPFCVNCKENGHTSNFRGCPAYKKYVSIRKKASEESNARKRSSVANVEKELAFANFSIPGRTFASLVKGSNISPRQSGPEKPAIIVEFLKIARTLCDLEPLTLEDKIENFMVNYKTFSKDQAKKECMSLLKDIQNVYGP